MKLSIVLVILCATLMSSGEAIVWINPTLRPTYQQGSQFIYNYQPGVPLPNNIQQVGTKSTIQQPGQVPLNYQFGGAINIQQLTQTGSTSSLPQQSNFQGIPIGSQQVVQTQSVPFGFQQQNGIPINTLQQTQIGKVNALGPIRFPQ